MTDSATQAGPPKGPDLIVDLQEALGEERAELGLTNGNGASAICLSGGGIRSAAFCLGVIQALAARQLLQEFHYLSTVSGGGYIGCWLTRMIAAYNGDVARAEEEVSEYKLVNAKLKRKESREPEEISQLRRFTNFLTPNPGLASADTWAGIALWFRNTLINWAVFFPLFLGIAAACVAYVGLLCGFEEHSFRHAGMTWYWIFAIAGLICSAVAAYNVCRGLPSHLPGEEKLPADGWKTEQIWHLILGPTLIWIFIAPFAFAPTLLIASQPNPSQLFMAQPVSAPVPAVCASVAPTTQPANTAKAKSPGATNWLVLAVPGGAVTLCDQASSVPSDHPVSKALTFSFWYLPIANFLVCLISFYAAWLSVCNSGGNTIAFGKNQIAWLFSALVSAGLLGLAYKLLRGLGIYWVAALGPALVMLIESLRVIIYIAVRTDGIFSDLDREWLARLSGYKVKIVLAATICILTATCLPKYFLGGAKIGWQETAAIFGFLTGPGIAWLGKFPLTAFSYGTSGSKSGLSGLITINRILAFVSILFGLNLIMLLAYLTDICAVHVFSAEDLKKFSFVSFLIALATVVVTVWCDRFINLNHFSMHAVYRNRLIRAFLGSARLPGDMARKDHEPTRSADPFTSFDPGDNFRLADCWPMPFHKNVDATAALKGRKKKRLFPVINVALGTTHGKDTARAERQAEAFTLTPLRCGGAELQRSDKKELKTCRGSYARTDKYAYGEKDLGPSDSLRGITLGTAMALSGAAVSPNMGYNSSPFTAFLMTLFNVRLGAWLPNPGYVPPDSETLKLSGPVQSVLPMLKELVGESDDKGQYVYLSDGGHFDNLGLYEMLRRRCAYILVVDSGRDTDYAYADLGHVLQSALIDLGVQVEFLTQIKIDDKVLADGFHYAKIAYPPNLAQQAAVQPDHAQQTAGWLSEVGPTSGRLIYLKPYLPPSTPVELLAYGQIRKTFPNATTANQFFTESDFESYRRLGELLANQLLSNFPKVKSVSSDDRICELFNAVARTVRQNQKQLMRKKPNPP